MSTTEETARRQSRSAVTLTLGAVALIMSTLVFAALRLNDLYGEIVVTENRLDSLRLEADSLEDVVVVRQAQIAGLAAGIAAADVEGSERDSVYAEVERSLREAPVKAARARTILWVDDRQEANRYEAATLEGLGFTVVRSQSTQDALDYLGNQAVSIVITDFARPGDPRAGYTLLEEMQADEYATPLIIYSSTATPEQIRDATDRGAYGQANNVSALVRLVTKISSATQLVAATNAPTSASRRAAQERLMDEFRSDPVTLESMITALEPPELGTLSADGRINALFYLRDRDPCGWTESQVARTESAIANIERRAAEGVAALGNQTAAAIEGLKATLEDVRACLVRGPGR